MNANATVGLSITPKNGNNGVFTDGTDSTFEVYGTSWLVDLLKAWEQNRVAQGLTAGTLRLNGINDPAQRFPTHARGGHSVGMGLDLGFKQYISPQYQYNSEDYDPPKDSEYGGTGWSVANAQTFSNLLGSGAQNNQAGALRNFLSLYALTINDGITNNGTWEDLQVVNGAAVRKALFGSGAQNNTQLIQNVWLGNTGSNKQGAKYSEYKGMHAVMNRLGINNANGVYHAATPPHEHHFHLDIRPPERVPVSGIRTSNLVADALAVSSELAQQINVNAKQASELDALNQWAQPTLSDETGDTYMFALPTFEAPHPYDQTVLVAKAAASSGVPVYGACFPLRKHYAYEKEYPTNEGHTALSPTGVVIYMGAFKDMAKTERRELERNANERVIVQPKYGQIVFVTDPNYPSRQYAQYVPNKGYEGRDRLAMEVEMGGKTFRVDYFIQVIDNFGNEGDGPNRVCEDKMWWCIVDAVQPNTSSTDLAAWQRSAQLSALIASAQQSLAGFTDLPSTALGQTTGEGATAQITLDQNAAGHGWYLDPTPLDNTDDYLPTSNPEVWQAKAGSAAAGKMDMLSVLLHEYGHALSRKKGVRSFIIKFS